jgi:hypothetical protein
MHVAAPQSRASPLLFSSLVPTITECWAVCWGVHGTTHAKGDDNARAHVWPRFSCASRASVLHNFNQAAFLVTALEPQAKRMCAEGGGLHLLMFAHCM